MRISVFEKDFSPPGSRKDAKVYTQGAKAIIMFVMPQASIRHAKMQNDRMPYRPLRGDKLIVEISLWNSKS